MTIRRRIEILEKKNRPEPEITVQVVIVDDINNEVLFPGTGETMSLEEYEKTKNPDAINIRVNGK